MAIQARPGRPSAVRILDGSHISDSNRGSKKADKYGVSRSPRISTCLLRDLNSPRQARGKLLILSRYVSRIRTEGQKKLINTGVSRSPELAHACCGTWIRTKMTTFRESHPTSPRQIYHSHFFSKADHLGLEPGAIRQYKASRPLLPAPFRPVSVGS